MSSPQIDLRALRRASRASNQAFTRVQVSTGAVAAVPRPRARWVTRLLLPAAVLLTTGGILAYAARDVLQPRLPVYVAAVIPKTTAAVAPTEGNKPAPADDTGARADEIIGPLLVQAPGWVEPAPFAVNVPALAEGVVEEVLVLEGDRLEAGQVVARLHDEDARLLLRAADSTIAERDSDVALARAALDTALSRVALERFAADELRDEVDGKRELAGAVGVSPGEYRRMEIRLRGLEAKVSTAERESSEARAALARAEAARESALVVRDEAALRLSRMEVRSPVSGVVLARLIEPGSRISMSSSSGHPAGESGAAGAVLRIYNPANLQVRVDVPLADAATVGVGTRAIVTTEAIADQSFTGVVSRIVHEANIQRNTVQFKVSLDAPSPVLKPEMLTRVKLHGPAAASNGGQVAATGGAETGGSGASGLMLLVPTSAVAAAGEGKGQVWVVDTSGGSPIARRREILTTLARDEGFVIATSGLRLTDRVILDSPAPPAIQDGTRLKILGERTTTTTETASSAP